MASKAMLNAMKLGAGLIDTLPVEEAQAPTLVPILKPFTQAGYEALIAGDEEVVAMRAALRAREEAIAKEAAKDVYARTFTFMHPLEGKQVTYDVQATAEFAADLIQFRADTINTKCMELGITKTNPKTGKAVPDRTADVNEQFWEKNPQPGLAKFVVALAEITAWLKEQGFNTSYGADGIWGIKRADVAALASA